LIHRASRTIDQRCIATWRSSSIESRTGSIAARGRSARTRPTSEKLRQGTVAFAIEAGIKSILDVRGLRRTPSTMAVADWIDGYTETRSNDDFPVASNPEVFTAIEYVGLPDAPLTGGPR
jgi:hypothetical protein